jgi:hypothetical protein
MAVRECPDCKHVQKNSVVQWHQQLIGILYLLFKLMSYSLRQELTIFERGGFRMIRLYPGLKNHKKENKKLRKNHKISPKNRGGNHKKYMIFFISYTF